MSKLNEIINKGLVRDTVFGLAKSHYNVVKLLGKDYVITPENISQVYGATIKYYNDGFAKLTGTIHQPDSIVEDYLILIKLKFSEEFREEKTILPVKGIFLNDVLTDFSLFSLYILLTNYKNIRVAVWEDLKTSEFALTTLNEVVHKTTQDVFNKTEKINILPSDKWKIVADNIVWNIKQQFGLFDDIQ